MEELFGTLGGLPLHPLVVHFAVVLIPLGAMGLIVVSVWQRLLTTFLPVIIGVLGVGSVFAFAAKESGEFLAMSEGLPREHADLGDILFPASIGLVALAITLWLVTRKSRSRPTRRVASVVAVVGAVAVSTLTLLVGHSGAVATWGETTIDREIDSDSDSDSDNGSDAAITMADVRSHNSTDDCWIVVSTDVLDLTSFISRHPGGAGALTALCGTDATAAFTSQHGGEQMPEAERAELTIGSLTN